MKQFQGSSWVDSRPVLFAHTIKAGSFKTAFSHIASITKHRIHKGLRVKEMTIRIHFVCGIQKDTIVPTNP